MIKRLYDFNAIFKTVFCDLIYPKETFRKFDIYYLTHPIIWALERLTDIYYPSIMNNQQRRVKKFIIHYGDFYCVWIQTTFANNVRHYFTNIVLIFWVMKDIILPISPRLFILHKMFFTGIRGPNFHIIFTCDKLISYYWEWGF